MVFDRVSCFFGDKKRNVNKLLEEAAELILIFFDKVEKREMDNGYMYGNKR